ncbi:DUF1593 domain-containing protein [Spirosoma sordidisoli]|uniref:DUF1593 domain-containing protein n=1 Tax=Spirosoma sordidisoli TaxID=2502893 RepID=A0A4Q2UW84_9BACT|nr:DUF1593 domain-containing protein [Spirosoma sordidisoli]RYC72110.1 DUF1593 domain-containing protein [Spirosoma sordidisoli]
MRLSFVFLMLLLVLPAWAQVTETRPKPRVLVLTDIENEPDDTQSLIRFMLYANQWDIEGLIATTSVHQQERVAPEKIREVVTAYGQVRANLALHEPGYPEAAQLLGLIRPALPRFGRQAVGPGNDSPGSDWIIQVVDKNDERPVWVLCWGGPNCLAQALWKVSMTRSAEELNRFVGKLRVYTISDQDDSGPWLRKTFPSLFYVASPGVYARGAYHYATWNGISGDRHHGRFSGADFSLVDNPWLDVNIRQGHGPLGALYPVTKYLMEGDTPSFLHLIDNGLSVPEHPDYGGWGGRYEYYQPHTRPWFSEPETRPFFTDADDEVKGLDGHMHRSNQATIWRWRQAYQHDFAARMDWCVKPFSEANHPPRVVLTHPAVLTVSSGEPITLSAQGSTDPDDNSLTYKWFYYPEAGTYLSHRDLVIGQPAAPSVTLTAPDVSKPETLHVIVSVTDNGRPALTRYQRVLVTVLPKIR